MSMIKITVEASIFPPSNEIGVGGSNPRIFAGKFTIEVPQVPELPNYWRTARWVQVGGLAIFVAERSKPDAPENKLFGKTHLPSVTPEYFAALQRDGWKLDEEAAQNRGYPRA